MHLHIQPHAIDETGKAGLGHAFLTEKSEREALGEWCRAKFGWSFRLERLTDYFHGSSLWRVIHGGEVPYKFVISRTHV